MAPMPIKPIRSAIMSSHLESCQGTAFRPGQVAHTARCASLSWARRSTREDVGLPCPGEGIVSIVRGSSLPCQGWDACARDPLYLQSHWRFASSSHQDIASKGRHVYDEQSIFLGRCRLAVACHDSGQCPSPERLDSHGHRGGGWIECPDGYGLHWARRYPRPAEKRRAGAPRDRRCAAADASIRCGGEPAIRAWVVGNGPTSCVSVYRMGLSLLYREQYRRRQPGPFRIPWQSSLSLPVGR